MSLSAVERIERADGVAVVFLLGDLLAANVDATREQILGLLDPRDPNPPTAIHLEFRGIGFIDSAGLGLLMGLRATLRKNNVDLVIVNPGRKVTELLRTTRLDKVLQIRSTGL